MFMFHSMLYIYSYIKYSSYSFDSLQILLPLHELNRSHLMVHWHASETRIQLKGNFEVTIEINDGCCSS